MTRADSYPDIQYRHTRAAMNLLPAGIQNTKLRTYNSLRNRGPQSTVTGKFRPATEVVGADSRIAYDGLTLFSPDGSREVLKNLTAEIRRGTNVLVVGPNEGARIALFRATASIWPAVEGRSSARSSTTFSSCPSDPIWAIARKRDPFVSSQPQSLIETR